MRKGIIAAIVAVALFAVGAFAATFTVTTEDVTSGTGEFAACATSVGVEFTTGNYSGTLGTTGGDFPVTQAVATFSGAGCAGKAATLAVLGSNGEAIAEFDVNVSGTTATFDIPTPGIPVGLVFGSAVLVEGTPIG